MSELLPCPFCGGETEIDIMQVYRRLDSARISNQVAIYCTSCNAHMSCDPNEINVDPDHVVAELTEAWNKRAANDVAQALKGEVTKLSEALAFYADMKRWDEYTDTDGVGATSAIERDEGAIARKAMELSHG